MLMFWKKKTEEKRELTPEEAVADFLLKRVQSHPEEFSWAGDTPLKFKPLNIVIYNHAIYKDGAKLCTDCKLCQLIVEAYKAHSIPATKALNELLDYAEKKEQQE